MVVGAAAESAAWWRKGSKGGWGLGLAWMLDKGLGNGGSDGRWHGVGEAREWLWCGCEMGKKEDYGMD